MAISRRTFMAAGAATLASATVMSTETNSPNAMSGQVVHNVYFWLKKPESLEDRDLLIAGLKTLSAIPAIKTLQIGLPANTEKRDVVDNSFNVFELMYFDSVEAQNEYQVNPLHTAFVENYGHLWEKVVVHDSVLV